MFGSEFDFAAFADFMAYFMDAALKAIFSVKDWFADKAKLFE